MSSHESWYISIVRASHQSSEGCKKLEYQHKINIIACHDGMSNFMLVNLFVCLHISWRKEFIAFFLTNAVLIHSNFFLM